jgi:UDP-glucose 4-epimerase
MENQKLILVTGGAGFIGSRLCMCLLEEGHQVISLDNYFTGSRENHVPGVDYRQGHTKDIEKHVSESPNFIYHLGEYSRVEKSLEEPALVWDLNKEGTFGVLEFWRKCGCKLIYVGSSTKFGDGGLGRMQSPYAWTKASNTELVQNYGTWYGLPYAITYFYNVYGPGERAGTYGTVIEIFRQKQLAGEMLAVTAPGTQKRNFTHIDDVIDGLMLVGTNGVGNDFGIGDEKAYSILEVAEMFEAEIIMKPASRGNRMSSNIDTSKTRLLGWSPKKNLIDYITEVRRR